MRYLLIVIFLACVPMQVLALVVEPEQKSATPKTSAPKTVRVPAKNVHAAKSELIQTKVSPSQENILFYQALQSWNFDMMRVYLAKGADINCGCNFVDAHAHSHNDQTPLMYATSSPGAYITNLTVSTESSYSAMRFLLENGANVNQQNSRGESALMLLIGAARSFSDDFIASRVALLIEYGANPSLKDNSGRDALSYLVRNGAFLMDTGSWGGLRTDTFESIATTLISKGANINQQDKRGVSPLMDAASYCHVGYVKLLLSLGADPNIKNEAGETALTLVEKIAVKSGQSSTCNQVYAVLSDSDRYRTSNPANTKPSGSTTQIIGKPTSTNSTSANADYNAYVGSYTGNYSGDDNGSFQIAIEQDGSIKLSGKSQRNNQIFTGNGKANSDGSLGITLGSISTGAIFQGSINPKTGALYGTWKNGEQAGNFSGSKQTTQAQVSNPIEAIGGLLSGINKVLAK